MATNKEEKFTFASVPASLLEMKTLPEYALDTPFKTAALTMIVLMNYGLNTDAMYEMLDDLKGPESVSNYDKQFIKDRLEGKEYKIASYFDGATVENSYTPDKPYTISIFENPYSYPDENWATMFVKSSGADSPRQLKFRRKPSTGQWFLNDIQCLSDIRTPAAADPWA